MRSREGQTEAWWTGVFSFDRTYVGPGWIVTPVGQGYDVRIVDPAYSLCGLTLLGTTGATEARVNVDAKAETPPRINFQFLTSAGAAGAYGGRAVLHVQRKTA